jgi:hypothetical protein
VDSFSLTALPLPPLAVLTVKVFLSESKSLAVLSSRRVDDKVRLDYTFWHKNVKSTQIEATVHLLQKYFKRIIEYSTLQKMKGGNMASDRSESQSSQRTSSSFSAGMRSDKSLQFSVTLQ